MSSPLTTETLPAPATSASIDPGLAIGSIATASGTDLVSTAIGVAAVLGSIAGPSAEIDGPMGERIEPGFNLVVAGGDNPNWYAAQKLMLDPVEACQREFRELSAAVTPERLDHLQSLRTNADQTNEMVSCHKEGVFNRSFGPGAAAEWIRPFNALRRPTFCLRSPTADVFEAAQPEFLDTTAFVYYPDGGFVTSPISPLATAIAGSDQSRNSFGLGRIHTTRVYLLETITRTDLFEALCLRQGVLQQCLLIEPRAESWQFPLELKRRGYLSYNEALRLALSRRHKGDGARLKAEPPVLAELAQFAAELQSRLVDLPPGFGRFFRHVPALPYRLLWAFYMLTLDGEAQDWCLPLVKLVTTTFVDRQRALLQDAFDAATRARLKLLRVTMLRKLQERPCRRRDLFRRYPVQRKELHAPVLCELIDEGLVVEQPNGVLELLPAAKAHLT